MIYYVTLGSNDLHKGGVFYDAVLAPIGAGRIFDGDRMIVWGPDPERSMLGLCLPYNKEPATVGNGVMVGLTVHTIENVDKMYATAIELGGVDEGAPGPRGGDYYGAYFRDLDGNKILLSAHVLGLDERSSG